MATTAATNTRYLVRSQGSPLTASTNPAPTTADLKPTEVLVRLRAVAVNPADYKMIDSGHRVQSWPLVAGLDGAGEVAAVGEQVSRFRVGDGVLAAFATGERSGSFQDFAVVEERMVAKKPELWSFEEAASVVVCYITALVGLVKGLGLRPPFLPSQDTTSSPIKSVLVLGGSSAVGAAAIQLLRLSLPPEATILATSSPRHHRHLEEYLGASKAVDRSSKSLVQDVQQLTPDGHGVDAIVDAVGAGAGSDGIFDVLRTDGLQRYAQVWTGDEEVSVLSRVDSVLFRSRDLPSIDGHEEVLRALEKLLEEGKYKLPLPVKVVDGRGLAAFESGLGLVRNGVSGEKVVVRL
ncbi:chaperonin 10-like protein [Microdochium trichocladiopsis]|uniref:Chaperonin 10-like protein n=1 Tax=Microdochium trichocladiopsis TaxID=1682393 RepID=A0A9P8XZD5_9PEZI|nr:chaperonin 10-like protein [Microdochium trichocladiopsis]KAH7025670.1 chaperonin 10-like protein [Microdochium trichocladiopsis]